MPAIILNYWLVALDNKLGSSRLWHLPAKKYGVLAAVRFHVIAHDEAVRDQCADSGGCLLSFGVLVLAKAHFRARIHDYGICHLIEGYTFDYFAALTVFYRLERNFGSYAIRMIVGFISQSIQRASMTFLQEGSGHVSRKPMVM